jgi:hypothetical protein
MTKLTNLSGSASMWAVPETQVDLQGWFDWEQVPDESTKDSSGDTFTGTFNYKFYYARPIEVAMVYPIVVHNQLLDKKFRDVPLEDHNEVMKRYSYSGRVYNAFRGAELSKQQLTDFGYSIPTFDEFMPMSVPIRSRRLLTVLFTIDEADPTLFLNLGQLGQKQFTPEILEYLKAERDYLVQPGMSAIHVGLYKHQFMIETNPAPITIDADLNVRGTGVTNLRVQHHLRIGLLTDLDFLRGDALARLQEHGKAAIQILLAIDPTLADRGYLPKLIGDNFVSRGSLRMAIANVRPENKPTGFTAHFNSVQFVVVETNHHHNV